MKRVIIGDTGQSLLGDAAYASPGLKMLSEKHKEKVKFVLNGPPRVLYAGSPYVELEPEGSRWEANTISISCNAGFNAAASRGIHISAGYFFRMGLNPNGQDTKPRIYIPELAVENLDSIRNHSNVVFLSPFSASCAVNQGEPANKTIPLKPFWTTLALELTKMGLHPISLGNTHEPPCDGTESWRGKDLKTVILEMNKARLFIGGDTGTSAIAGMLNLDMVFLNSALPLYMISPQTYGKLEVLETQGPPSWKVEDVLSACRRVLE